MNETPYLRNLGEEFHSKYDNALAAKEGDDVSNTTDFCGEFHDGDVFPGVIRDFGKQDARGGGNLPPLMHLFDKTVIRRELERVGFRVEELRYLDRRDDFPAFLHWDGRESVGACCLKE